MDCYKSIDRFIFKHRLFSREPEEMEEIMKKSVIVSKTIEKVFTFNHVYLPRVSQIHLVINTEFDYHIDYRGAKKSVDIYFFFTGYNPMPIMGRFKSSKSVLFDWMESNGWILDEGKIVTRCDTVTKEIDVKEHKEYKGEKQTEVTRCKVVTKNI